MYHRIALDGPDALRRFRVAPEVFRKQMQFLRREGYYALTAQSLAALLRDGKPIQGRPVVLTFDDAYLDFLTDAFPILAENGFGADVFVVTDKVGGRSDWDAAYGDTSPADVLGRYPDPAPGRNLLRVSSGVSQARKLARQRYIAGRSRSYRVMRSKASWKRL